MVRLWIVCLSIILIATPSKAFPSEDEVKSGLHKGATVEQVIKALGEPPNGRVPDCRNCNFVYLAPVNALTIEREGYRGVIVHFEDGKVSWWRFYTGIPSYDPTLKMPLVFKWELWLFGGAMVLAYVLRFLLRRMPVGYMAYTDALAAYAARDIAASPRLPSE